MSKNKLLFSIYKKDFNVQTFKSGGPGGQHQNKTDSGVRITHAASGAVGESRTDKSQHRNKRLALKRLTESKKFKIWMTQKVYETATGKTVEQRVDESMVRDNLKLEIKNSKGNWCETKELEREEIN